MHDVASELREVVNSAADRLACVPDNRAAEPISPGKWSPKQIIGHLIDSASNNHGRFVRSQLSDSFLFLPYEQDGWVRVQDYAHEDWRSLVELWRAFNLHLAHVIDRIPTDVAEHERARHNLDEIAWKTVPHDQPATLDYFVRDYVAHMKHHLGQIPD